jgi:fibronectin-binding autotransporter adhesin
VAPGLAIGTLTTGDLRFKSGAVLSLEIQGTALHDQLAIAGTLTLEGEVPLVLTLGYDPTDFVDEFVLVANDGSDAKQGDGVFVAGGRPLPQSAEFPVATGEVTQWFRIDYAGGDGNDVTVRAVPEPGTTSLLAAALAWMGGRGARRLSGRTRP